MLLMLYLALVSRNAGFNMTPGSKCQFRYGAGVNYRYRFVRNEMSGIFNGGFKALFKYREWESTCVRRRSVAQATSFGFLNASSVGKKAVSSGGQWIGTVRGNSFPDISTEFWMFLA